MAILLQKRKERSGKYAPADAELEKAEEEGLLDMKVLDKPEDLPTARLRQGPKKPGKGKIGEDGEENEGKEWERA